MFRELLRRLAGNLDGFNQDEQALGFEQLSMVDKMMALELTKFLSQQQELMDRTLDIKQYVSNLQDFMASRVLNFYIEFSGHRLLARKGAPEFLSSQQTLL